VDPQAPASCGSDLDPQDADLADLQIRKTGNWLRIWFRTDPQPRAATAKQNQNPANPVTVTATAAVVDCKPQSSPDRNRNRNRNRTRTRTRNLDRNRECNCNRHRNGRQVLADVTRVRIPDGYVRLVNLLCSVILLCHW
jgi:hypothetical protein